MVSTGSTVSSSTSQYTIVAIINSTVGTAVGTASIQVSPANVALPGGNIPVALLVILIPGLLSTAIFSWISGVKLGVDWRTAILSFLLGSLAWFVAPFPIGGAAPLERNVLSFSLQFSTPDLESVVLWMVVIGIVPAIVFSIISNLAPRIETALEDELRKVRGPQVQQTDTIGYALARAVKKSYKRSPRASASLAVVAGSPPATTSGLLKAFDDSAPYDLLLVPRYTIEMTNADFAKAVDDLPWWSFSLKSRVKGLGPSDLKNLPTVRKSDVISLTAMIGDRVRKTAALVPPKGQSIETVIKGGEVHKIEVLDYVSPYTIVVKDARNGPVELP